MKRIVILLLFGLVAFLPNEAREEPPKNNVALANGIIIARYFLSLSSVISFAHQWYYSDYSLKRCMITAGLVGSTVAAFCTTVKRSGKLGCVLMAEKAEMVRE